MKRVLFPIALILAALAIVVLNDHLKARRARKLKAVSGAPTDASSSRHTSWTHTIVLAVGCVSTCLGLALAPEVTKWALGGLMILLVAFVAYVLLKDIPKLIGLYLKTWFSGNPLPRFAWSQKDGTITMKCPRCGARIRMEWPQENQSESAFVCSHCGEEGTLRQSE